MKMFFFEFPDFIKTLMEMEYGYLLTLLISFKENNYFGGGGSTP